MRQGKVVYLLKTPYRDGTTHVVFEPLDFIARLAALVPRPRVNLTRYHGVLAPNHRWRAEVTPSGRGRRKGKGTAQARALCHRAARGDELGPTTEAGLWHRRGELRALRPGGEDHRLHRGAGADRADPRACAGKTESGHCLTRPTVDRAAGECVSGAHGARANREQGRCDRGSAGAVLCSNLHGEDGS
ncbi:MAG: transposase [Gammaproteobacteria bacterium]|nr:transposase [Gammaproteobacteria bacterium]